MTCDWMGCTNRARVRLVRHQWGRWGPVKLERWCCGIHEAKARRRGWLSAAR